jgi:WD40 repeat protein
MSLPRRSRLILLAAPAVALACLVTAGCLGLFDHRPPAPGTAVRDYRDRVQAVAYTPDGRTLITAIDPSGDPDDGIRGGSVELWDAATGKLRSSLRPFTAGVNAVAVSPDGKLLATGGLEYHATRGRPDIRGECRLWDPATGAELGELRGHENSVQAVAFSPDGRRLATASQDTTVKVWDVPARRELATFRGHFTRKPDGVVKAGTGMIVLCVAFSPDGRLVASGGCDGRVKVWDVAANREATSPEGHDDWVYGVAFTPDSRRLVSACRDGSVKVWDVATGKELLTLHGTAPVHGVSVSPDGRLIAAAERDGIRLWDAATGDERTRLTGPRPYARAVAFSPEGRFVAVGFDFGAGGYSDPKREWAGTYAQWDVTTGQKRPGG